MARGAGFRVWRFEDAEVWDTNSAKPGGGVRWLAMERVNGCQFTKRGGIRPV